MHIFDINETSAASADVATLDKQDEIVVISPDPYKGPVMEQEGFLGSKNKVPVIPAGHLDKNEVKKGAAGRVKMPSGTVISAGGELLRLALSRGGILVEE